MLCVPWGHILPWLPVDQSCSHSWAELPGKTWDAQEPTGVTGARLLWEMDMGWYLEFQCPSASSKVHPKMLQRERRDHKERNFFCVCR